MDSPDLIKPAAQHNFVADNETKMESLPWLVDEPIKSGEILRNDKGQYSFMCFHCGFAFQEFEETIKHIETHFETNDVKFDIETQATEFVLCAETESDPTDVKNTTLESGLVPMEAVSLSDLDTTIPEPKICKLSKEHLNKDPVESVRRRRRKRKLKLDVPQHCPICELWSDNFREHMKSAHDFSNRIFQCYICRAFFKSFIALRNHISSTSHTKSKCYHCDMEPPITNPSDARRHKCLFCQQWYPNHHEFKIHFKEAHDKDADYFFHKRSNCNIFTCYVCEREFPLRYYLVAHMKTHHEKFLSHQCPTCGRRVRTFGQLTQHLKTHEGKTYKCDQCDKKFPYYAKLRVHFDCHKTELKFKCNVCSKAFKVRKYLTRHMAVHDDVKKFGCRFCEAKFNFTSGRRAHEKSQHKAV